MKINGSVINAHFINTFRWGKSRTCAEFNYYKFALMSTSGIQIVCLLCVFVILGE